MAAVVDTLHAVNSAYFLTGCWRRLTALRPGTRASPYARPAPLIQGVDLSSPLDTRAFCAQTYAARSCHRGWHG